MIQEAAPPDTTYAHNRKPARRCRACGGRGVQDVPSGNSYRGIICRKCKGKGLLGIDATAVCAAPPGSEVRMAMYSMRADLGMEIWNSQDAGNRSND